MRSQAGLLRRRKMDAHGNEEGRGGGKEKVVVDDLMMGLLWMMSAPFVSMATPCHAKLTVDIGSVVLQLFLFSFLSLLNL